MLILFGGSSEERLVSVASAQNLMNHLPEAILVFLAPNNSVHLVEPAELARHKDPFTQPFQPSSAAVAGRLEAALELLKSHTFILALHGTEGEDGEIQGMLEKHRIAFTGSSSKASRQAFDKKQTKQLALSRHLKITDDLLLERPGSAQDQKILREFFQTHGKMVLKPVANGSSVGLFIIDSKESLENAINNLRADVGSYLAEKFITGREITVGVRHHLDGRVTALPCSEVRVIEGRQFDYEGKYLGKGVQELTPAPLTPEETLRCQEMALKVHQTVGCEGYTRTDMILTAQGPVLLEINTLPGLSKASFIPQQLVANSETLRSFFIEQVALAEHRNSLPK